MLPIALSVRLPTCALSSARTRSSLARRTPLVQCGWRSMICRSSVSSPQAAGHCVLTDAATGLDCDAAHACVLL